MHTVAGDPGADEVSISSMTTHVLMAQDNALLASMLTSLLERSGCSVMLAETTEKACQLLESRRPALLILDEALPEEGARQIAQAAYRNHMEGRLITLAAAMPIIMLTANCPLDVEEGTAKPEPWLPAHPLITVRKPIQLDRFEALIRRCLAAGRAALDEERALQAAESYAPHPAPQDHPHAALGIDATLAQRGTSTFGAESDTVPWIDGDWGDQPPLPNLPHDGPSSP